MILNLSLSAPSQPLPDAGKAYADKCEYEHTTRTVTVHSRNPQAGEVKDPEGEIRKFPITLPDAGRLWVEFKTNSSTYSTTYYARARVVRPGVISTTETEWVYVATASNPNPYPRNQ